MQALGADLLGFAGALGIGLLIGVERERAKGEGPGRDVAGVRTFALCGLTGAAAMWLGPAAIVSGGLVLGLLVLAGYRHTQAQDPGLTTEIAMLATFLLGMMALRSPVLAGGLGVVVAGLLAAKNSLHRFVKQGLSERELEDLLLLLAAAFIVLPLLPDRAIDPWGALVPRKLWMLVVAVMTVSSIGYVALRTVGPRLGLALAGLAGGFVSSTATIAALGERARSTPVYAGSLASAALVSNVSTIVQLAIVIGTLSPALLLRAAWPLAAAGAVALLTALAANFHAEKAPPDGRELAGSRPLQPRQALIFAAIVAVVFLIAAIARDQLGNASLPWVLALSGFADVHASAASAAQLAGAGLVEPRLALFATCAALATNSVMKCVLAMVQGGRAFAWRVVPGVLGMVLAFLVVAALQKA